MKKFKLIAVLAVVILTLSAFIVPAAAHGGGGPGDPPQPWCTYVPGHFETVTQIIPHVNEQVGSMYKRDGRSANCSLKHEYQAYHTLYGFPETAQGAWNGHSCSITQTWDEIKITTKWVSGAWDCSIPECPEGQVFNEETAACEVVVPECEEGEVLDTETNTCVVPIAPEPVVSQDCLENRDQFLKAYKNHDPGGLEEPFRYMSKPVLGPNDLPRCSFYPWYGYIVFLNNDGMSANPVWYYVP